MGEKTQDAKLYWTDHEGKPLGPAAEFADIPDISDDMMQGLSDGIIVATQSLVEFTASITTETVTRLIRAISPNNRLKMHGIPKRRRRARHGIDSTHHNFYNT